MSGTYRQGFDGKWPGEPKEDQGTTHPKQVSSLRKGDMGPT